MKAWQGKERLPRGFGKSWVLAGLCVLALSCCKFEIPDLTKSPEQVAEATPYTVVTAQQAWVSAPGALVVIERRLPNSAEQRIGLENKTLVPGDNFLFLRTHGLIGLPGPFRFDDFTAMAGGLPVPFTTMKSGDLQTAQDAAGTYFWADSRSGVNTVCVFAVRRLDAATRQMPDSSGSMDILLRNCVDGTNQQALRPILAESVLSSTEAAASPGKSRLIAPLAGPTMP